MAILMRCLFQGRELAARLDGENLYVLDENYPARIEETGERLALSDIEAFLPPVRPGKVVAIGLNYRDHAAEFHLPIPEDPVSFLLAPSSVAAHEQEVHAPYPSFEMGFEAELAVVIGAEAFRVPEAEALEYVLGFTCANDITARNIQRRDGQWGRSKSYPTFTPLGPWLVTGLDPSDLRITMNINGEIRQRASTANCIFSVGKIIESLSDYMVLNPGDVIITGTPGGVGLLERGDIMEVEISGIGILRNVMA